MEESDGEVSYKILFMGKHLSSDQRYTYRVLQRIQMKLILWCVWVEPAGLGSTKTALKFKYEIQMSFQQAIECWNWCWILNKQTEQQQQKVCIQY